MPGDAESSPPVQEQMDGGELVRTRTVQDRQRGPAGRSGGILDAAQAPPQLDTDAHAPAPNAQLPHGVRGGAGKAAVGPVGPPVRVDLRAAVLAVRLGVDGWWGPCRGGLDCSLLAVPL